jgi:hypothetical protein
MLRNLVTLGVFLLVAGLLWVITEWPASTGNTSDSGRLEVPEPAAPEPPPPAAAASPPVVAKAPEPAPEPPEEEPAAEPAPAPQVRQLPDQITGDQGPVAEYRSQFESEPRSSSASDIEADLRAAFPASDGAPDLVKSILCRQTLCRMEMRWSQDRMRAYIVGSTRLRKKVEIPLALSPVGPKARDGQQLVEVYMKLKSPTAAVRPEH